jgi:hypothetical protein
MSAPSQEKPRREYQKTDYYKRVRKTKHNGFRAINGRTYAGREAKAWAAWAIAQKGGSGCRLDIRQQIELAAVDKWLMLELEAKIIKDARERGSILNLRRKQLPKIHDQFNTVSMRFEKRREALELKPKPRGNGKNPNLRELLEEIDDDG